MHPASDALGKWMSAALEDPAVCQEMKNDIQEWFAAGQPPKCRHVCTVVKEPDYWSRGHFYEGYRPHIPFLELMNMPIGTKLYIVEE